MTSAVWMTARAELRRRWRTWVALGVLVGTFGGFVVAAFAGARRTDTVVDRAIAAKVPPDIVMLPAFSLNGDLLRFEAIRAFPEVVEAHRLPLYFDRDGIEVLGSRDISVFGRSNLLAGRLPRADEPDEVTVNFLARERLGLDVGDTTTLHLAKAGSALEGEFVAGPSVPVRVVGVTASLGDFATVAEPGASVTPAFVRFYGEQAASVDLLAFRLRRGDRDLPAFGEHTRELTGGKPVVYVELRNDRRQIQRSFQVQAFGLWMLGAFLALVAVLVLAQTLARQTFLESADHGILSSLGMGRRHLIGVHLIRSLFIGVVAGLGTMAVSYGLSGFAPFGRARLLEPAPGLAFEVLPIALGALAAVGFVVGVSTLAASFARTGDSGEGRSWLAGRVTRIVRGAPGVVGVRLALEPGRGSTAVPVRSSLIGSTLGIIATVTAIVVWASLQHMTATPRVYGWAWDAVVGGERYTEEIGASIATLPGVEGVSFGNDAAQVDVGGEVVSVMSMDRGPVGPVVLAGRAPAASGEVALGRKTLDAIGRRIGDRIGIAIQGVSTRQTMEIVGEVVLPLESDTSTLGEGAFLTLDGLRTLEPSAPADTGFVRFEEGADRVEVVRRLRSLVGEDGVRLPSEPGVVVDFGRVRAMPLVLASVIALLSLATTAHVLISTGRRRRRDLAILKALGFVRGQVRRAVAWQASTLAVVSLVLGLPLGIALGRWTWTLLASFGGFVPEVDVPLLSVGGVAIGTLLATNMLAALPARAAARTQPALVLRSE